MIQAAELEPRAPHLAGDLLGHTTVQMTKRYAHLAPENARAAVERLSGAWSRFGHGDENVISENNINSLI